MATEKNDSIIQRALNHIWDNHIPNRKRYARINQYMLVDDRVEEVKRVVVHEFTMGDVEDPVLYAGEPLYKWQTSEQGQWVMQHAIEPPEWHQMVDHTTFGYRFKITAKLMGPSLTEYYLKYGNQR